MEPIQLEVAATMFAALADVPRLMLLMLLAEQEHGVTELADFPTGAPPTMIAVAMNASTGMVRAVAMRPSPMVITSTIW